MKWATFNYLEFEIPDEAVDACSHSGSCDKDVDYWHSQIDLNHISDDDLIRELREQGYLKGELKDRILNEKRIIWIGCGNIKEDETRGILNEK